MNKNKDYIQNIDNAERRFFVAPVTIEKREGEDQSHDVVGHAALYGKRANIGNMFEEEISAGAFDDILNDDVRCLFNHDPNYVLARSSNGQGTLRLSIDEAGLRYSYKTPNRTYALDLEDAIRTGDISQSSFAFKVKDDVWTERSGDIPLRTITKMERIYDVAPVTYPAYQDATVGKRSLEGFRAINIEVQDPKTIEQNNERAEAFDVYDAQYQFNLNKSK